MEKRIKNNRWRELCGRKEELQSIIRLLVEFDEKTRRVQRYGLPEMHYMRRAISIGSPENLRVFMMDIGGFVYYIIAELNSDDGFVCTAWVHEDGIRAERDEFTEDSSHPVHSIVCVSDLYETDTEDLRIEKEDEPLQSVTLEMLQKKSLELTE